MVKTPSHNNEHTEKSINIDEKFDLEIAKLLIKNGDCNNKPKLY